MTKDVKDTFNEALKAAQRLPEATQEALAEELRSRIDEFTGSHMSEGQRAEVKRRLALPRRHVPTGKVEALLRLYNPSV